MDEAVELIRTWCAKRADRRAHRRRPAPPRPHTADRLRVPSDRRRRRRPHGAALRPPRQAAGDDGLARRPRPVEAGGRGRPALRAGRRGRRLCRLRRVLAIEAAEAEGIPHARCIVLIEASEESGSPDLPAHVDHLGDRLGTPELVVCLDSGCLDTDRLWLTTSLRGMAVGRLTVEVLEQGAHSGSGQRHRAVQLPHHAPAARSRRGQRRPARSCFPSCTSRSPPTASSRSPAPPASSATARTSSSASPARHEPMSDDPIEQFVAQSWRPTLSYIGADGLPPTGRSGNVLRPSTTLALSFRLPPTCDAAAALAAVERVLLADPPSQASVTLHGRRSAPGLERAVARALARRRAR